MTVINPNSISGITSITLPSGDGNVLTIHTNDGTERFRIDSSGNVKVGSAATISPDGDLFITGVCTATTLAGSGANLTSLPAANLTGALPAISGANLTGIAATDNVRTGILEVAGIATFSSDVKIGAAVTISESGIEASGIGITCANINGAQIGGRRNIVINGAMLVAQRGTSSTGSGYKTLDRMPVYHLGTNESPTISQADIASGTTPYTLGFRKALKITNGNQTGGADAADYIWFQTKLEAQDISNSGWNYTSSSSYLTLSFWIKSSVAQTFKCYFRTMDGTNQQYPFETGSLTADTWTKITKTISGNSNIQIDNDNGQGFQINIPAFIGTDSTNNSATEDAWSAYSSSARMKDCTSTWYTTNDATLEITGIQLEVGPQATPFEHRSFGEELALCQRYYQKFVDGATGGNYLGIGCNYSTAQSYMFIRFLQEMRSTPTIDQTNISSSFVLYDSANQSGVTFSSFSGFAGECTRGTGLYVGSLSTTAGLASIFQVINGTAAYMAASAEI